MSCSNSASYAQFQQLQQGSGKNELGALMPSSFRKNSTESSWRNGLAPQTQSGQQGYITSSSGFLRNRVDSRDPRSKLGLPNPLRTQPAPPLSTETCVIFNDSSYRREAVRSLDTEFHRGRSAGRR
jgi:hypothetical protein